MFVVLFAGYVVLFPKDGITRKLEQNQNKTKTKPKQLSSIVSIRYSFINSLILSMLSINYKRILDDIHISY